MLLATLKLVFYPHLTFMNDPFGQKICNAKFQKAQNSPKKPQEASNISKKIHGTIFI